MTNKHVGILIALLAALSTGLAEARQAGETHPHHPLPCSRATSPQSWDIESPDQAWSSPTPAAKRLANLNVGPPRTVRLIYFLPNDRPYRAEVVTKMKTTFRRVQTFYAEQMQAHGYGNRTFRLETDAAGEPLVHRVDGRHPDSYYLGDTFSRMQDELSQAFDLWSNIYIIVIDNGISGIEIFWGQRAGGVARLSNDKEGGWGLFSEESFFYEDEGFNTMAHELGHAFRLEHDFRDDAYIMSYGPGGRLSACSARLLAVHPYFNPDVPTSSGWPPTIELISSSRYPAGSNSVPVQLRVDDPDGLHQVTLMVYTRTPHFAAGQSEVKACRELGDERKAVVEFDYDGVIPSAPLTTSLSMSIVHHITVTAVDRDGNIGYEYFTLAEISPYHIATLEGHGSPGYRVSVAFSPNGETLAAGSWDGAVKLWDMAAKTKIATLGTPGFGALADEVSSVAFSPDGKTLATGLADGAVKLWNVNTKTNIATFTIGTTRPVSSVAFSPDGKTLAAGSEDGAVELWDVATKTNTTLGMPRQADNVSSAAFSPAVAFSPDGGTLAVGAVDRTVQLWDVAAKTKIATFGPTEAVYSVAFSPDGTTLATGGRPTVHLWDMATKTNIATFKAVKEVYVGIPSVAFSPDGTTLAAGAGATVQLWDVAAKTNIATFATTKAVYSVAFSPDGTILATGQTDATVQLWDVSEWTGSRPHSLVKTSGDEQQESRPHSLAKVSGDEQQRLVGTQLDEPFVVLVLDEDGAAFAGAVVTFSVSTGGGTLSAATATTDANGRARSTLTLGPEPGTNTVTATVEGLRTETFTAIGQATTDSDDEPPGEDQQESEEQPTTTVELEGISASHDSIRENDEQATVITLTVTLDKAAATDEQITLSIVTPTEGKAAKRNQDFDATLDETLTMAKGRITGTAQLSLTPKDNTTADGDKAFAVQATSSSGHQALIDIKIVDDEMDDGEEEDSELAFGFAAEVEDQAYTAGTTITALQLPEATGGEGEITYRVSDLPAGLSFDAATRTLSGTPEAATAETVEVTYTAQDSTEATATLTFSITVNPPLSFGDLFGLFN